MHLTADTLKGLPRGERVNLVNSLSGFKSANLVGTRSENGQENLAMVGSCFHLGADPALMGMILRPHSVDRHSLEYLQGTGVYTLNQAHAEILEAKPLGETDQSGKTGHGGEGSANPGGE